MFLIGVLFKKSERSNGVVTTATSTRPFLRASNAWGVEWLETRIRTPGYSCRYSFKIGSNRQWSANSLAPIVIIPRCIVFFNAISSSPASICSKAIRICSNNFSPSGVSCTPCLERTNNTQRFYESEIVILQGVSIDEKTGYDFSVVHVYSNAFSILIITHPVEIRQGKCQKPMKIPAFRQLHGFNWLTVSRYLGCILRWFCRRRRNRPWRCL